MSDFLPLQLVAVTCRDLHAYEIACTIRLVCRGLGTLLADAVVPIRLGPTHGAAATSASSHPVPLHAVLWALTDAPTRHTLTLRTRLRLLEVAVSRCQTEDHLRQLEPALSRFGGPVTFDAPDRHGRWDCKDLILDPARAAAAASNRTALLWLRSRGWPLDPDGLLHAAARHADLPFLQWLHTTFLQPQPPATAADSSPGPRPRLKDTTLVAAAASTTPDALDKVTWLVSQGCYVSGQVACAAAAQGNLPVLQLLAAQGGWTPDARALEAALRGGATHVADWLVRQGYCSLTSQGAYEAAVKGVASGGSVASMEWVQQQGEDVWRSRPWLYQTCLLEAAQVGACAEVLDWLVGLGANPSEAPKLIARAARSGSTATVRHLMGLGAWAEPGPAELRSAACCKDIAMFTWLVNETECEWGEHVTSVVMKNLAGRGTPDSLAVVQWFMGVRGREYVHGKYGCAVMAACWAGNTAVVRWLVEELGHQPGPNALNAAANSGCCALVELLLSYGNASTSCCGGDAYVNAAEQGDLEMLQLLWARQVPWGAGAAVRLVHPRTSRLGGPTQLASLRWLLLDAGVPSDLSSLLDRAYCKKRPDIVQLVEQAAARQQDEQEGRGQEMAANRCSNGIAGLFAKLSIAASWCSKVRAAIRAVWGRQRGPGAPPSGMRR